MIPMLVGFILGSRGMRETTKMYLLASSIPFFFPAVISLYILWQLCLSASFTHRRTNPLPWALSVINPLIKSLSLKPHGSSWIRVTAQLRVLTYEALLGLCMASVLSFIICAGAGEFSCTAACYVSYSEHWCFMKVACSHQSRNYTGF